MRTKVPFSSYSLYILIVLVVSGSTNGSAKPENLLSSMGVSISSEWTVPILLIPSLSTSVCVTV